MNTVLSKFSSSEQWLQNVLILTALTLLGFFIQTFFFKFLKLSNKRKTTIFKEQLLLHLSLPSKFFIPLLFIYNSSSFLELRLFWSILIKILVIISFTWILIAFLKAMEEVVKQKFEVKGNHKAKNRKVLTQLRFLKNLTLVIVITIAIAGILWYIPEIRNIGNTILTSAGIIGIIAGATAQKPITNLITGFQIVFSKPFKINNKVIVENEFGTIKDITLTYIVIKTWDWRQLVLPLNYFNDKPLVNWTFNTTEIIGSAFLYVDYVLPIDDIKEKLTLLLKQNALEGKNSTGFNDRYR